MLLQAAHDEMNQQSVSTGSMDDMQATEIANTNGNTEAPISYVANHSNHEAQMIESQTPMVPLARNSSDGFFQADLSSAGVMENHMDRQDHSSDQLAQAASQPIENPIQLINEVLLQPVTCTAPQSTPYVAMSDTRTALPDTGTVSANFDISNSLMQPMQPSVSQMHSLPYIDPLEKELEKLRREIDQNVDIHSKRVSFC